MTSRSPHRARTVGIFTWGSVADLVRLGVTEQEREGVPAGNHVLSGDYQIPSGGWGGYSQNLAAGQDWSSFRGIRLAWYASQPTRPASPTAGDDIKVELKDGGPDGEHSEVWAATFKDNWSSDGSRWKIVDLPFSQFTLSGYQPGDAATRNGTLDLTSAWGYAVTFVPGTATPVVVGDRRRAALRLGGPGADGDRRLAGRRPRRPRRDGAGPGDPDDDGRPAAARGRDGRSTRTAPAPPWPAPTTTRSPARSRSRRARRPARRRRSTWSRTRPTRSTTPARWRVDLTATGAAVGTSPEGRPQRRRRARTSTRPSRHRRAGRGPARPDDAGGEDRPDDPGRAPGPAVARADRRPRPRLGALRRRLGADAEHRHRLGGHDRRLPAAGPVHPAADPAALRRRRRARPQQRGRARRSSRTTRAWAPRATRTWSSRSSARPRRRSARPASRGRSPRACASRATSGGAARYESFGEDPALVTAMADAAVVGLQGSDPSDLSGTGQGPRDGQALGRRRRHHLRPGARGLGLPDRPGHHPRRQPGRAASGCTSTRTCPRSRRASARSCRRTRRSRSRARTRSGCTRTAP